MYGFLITVIITQQLVAIMHLHPSNALYAHTMTAITARKQTKATTTGMVRPGKTAISVVIDVQDLLSLNALFAKRPFSMILQ